MLWRPLFGYGVGEVVAIVSVVQNDGFDWLLKVIYALICKNTIFTKRHSEYRLVVPVKLILARALVPLNHTSTAPTRRINRVTLVHSHH